MTSPKRDYRYRMFADPGAVAVLMGTLVADIKYSNFKDQVRRTNGPDEYEQALHDVWHRMLVVQLREERKWKRQKGELKLKPGESATVRVLPPKKIKEG
jgi:hypothetical protein